MGDRTDSAARSRASSAVSDRSARLQLDRILASRAFRRAGRISRFLRYTVEQTLDGRGEELKEYLVAVEVFDRKPDFDSGQDPIVRVEARRLRSKLRQYYDGEGRNDEIEIEFPIGSYLPRFCRRGPSSPAREATADDRESLVVLPFTNLSPDPENEYFCDGLTEQIIHELTKLEGLRVVAWQSAFQLKGTPCDLRTIGERLRARVALGGSVRRSGDRLRIAAQLVLIEDGRYLWSETYERQMRDVLGIQDEISQAIAATLQIRLSAGAMQPVRKKRHDPVAYNLYLRGRFHWNRRSPEDLRKSIQYYERAIAIDPDFALAYAGLSDSYSLVADYGVAACEDTMPKARFAAEKALALDGSLAEAHTSLGFIKSLYDWDWPSGEAHYRRSIALNPGYATAHHWYGLDFLALQCRHDEALAEVEIAVQLDPLSPIINDGLGYVHILARRFDEAVAHYRRAADLDPLFYKTYTGMGRAYSLLGRYDDAITMFEKGRSLAGDVPSILGALGHTYGMAGHRQKALGLLDELQRLAERGFIASSCFALVHIGLGEKDRALRWLELGCERRDIALTSIGAHPIYDPLRSEPRFLSLLKKMGFGK